MWLWTAVKHRVLPELILLPRQAETRAEFAERSVAKLEKTIDDLEGKSDICLRAYSVHALPLTATVQSSIMSRDVPCHLCSNSLSYRSPPSSVLLSLTHTLLSLIGHFSPLSVSFHCASLSPSTLPFDGFSTWCLSSLDMSLSSALSYIHSCQQLPSPRLSICVAALYPVSSRLLTSPLFSSLCPSF